MGWWDWIDQKLQVDSWGVTPMSLAIPVGLVALIIVAGRLARQRSAKTESRDIGGMVLITLIIGAAFLFIFSGVGFLHRTFG